MIFIVLLRIIFFPIYLIFTLTFLVLNAIGLKKIASLPLFFLMFTGLGRLYWSVGRGTGKWTLAELDRSMGLNKLGRFSSKGDTFEAYEHFYQIRPEGTAFMVLCGGCNLFFAPHDSGWDCSDHKQTRERGGLG